MKSIKKLKITPSVVGVAQKAVKVALEYEKLTGRKLGITGEVGEVLVASILNDKKKYGLELASDPINPEYDAVDKNRKRVQIKARRSQNLNLPRGSSKVGKCKPQGFDYVLLGLLDRNYDVKEIYKASIGKIRPYILKSKRNAPTIQQFKKAAGGKSLI